MKLRFVERTWLLKMKQEEKKVSKGYDNELQMEFDAISYNEGFARMAVSAFIAPLNPTMEEMADVKTAVSEAVPQRDKLRKSAHVLPDYRRCAVCGDRG